MNETIEGIALPTLRLRLPGSWWQIPLTDRELARSSVTDLVRTQVGISDERARFRREYTTRLLAALDESIEGDGQSFHVALSIVERIPIPASIAVNMPRQTMTPAVGTSAAAVMAILERGLALAATDTWSTAHRFETRESRVLRMHRHQDIAVPEGEAIDALVADYWMTVPQSKRVVMLSCSTALGPLEEVMLGFFDSIVRAAYWEQPPTTLR